MQAEKFLAIILKSVDGIFAVAAIFDSSIWLSLIYLRVHDIRIGSVCKVDQNLPYHSDVDVLCVSFFFSLAPSV